MVNFSLLLIYVIISCLMIRGSLGFKECTCSESTYAFPTPPPKKSSLMLSDFDVVQNGESYGKLIAVDSWVLLQNIFSAKLQSLLETHECPSGFFPLTKDQLETILARNDKEKLFGKDYLNLQDGQYYFTNTKKSSNQFIFYALEVTENREFKIKLVLNEKFQYNQNQQIICKLDPNSLPFSINGYDGYDLLAGKTYEFSIEANNVLSYYIEAGEQKFYTKSFVYQHEPQTDKQCVNISIKLQLFNGAIAGKCFTFWTQPRYMFGFDMDSTLNLEDIKKFDLANVKARHIDSLFQSPGTAPIAPIEKDSSSFFILYSKLSDTNLYVQKMNNKGEKVGEEIPMNESGNPFDIIATSFGFFVMAGDIQESKSWIALYAFDGSQIWKRIITNLEVLKERKDEQSKNNSKINNSSPEETTQSNDFKLLNGKLNFFRGRLYVLSTYQYIQYSYDVKKYKRDYLLLNLSAETGYDVKKYLYHHLSNILTQQSFMDGDSILVFWLSDLQSEKFGLDNCKFYQKEQRCDDQSDPFSDISLSNENGNTPFRLGGFIKNYGNRDKIFFIYSINRIKQESEVSLMILGRKLNSILKVNKVSIFTGDEAENISNLKVVRYGNSILLGYNKMITPTEQLNLKEVSPLTHHSYLALINTEGKVLNGPFQVEFQISASDDWKVLDNGAIVYSYVNPLDGQLSVRFLPEIIAISSTNSATNMDDYRLYKLLSFILLGITLVSISLILYLRWKKQKQPLIK